MMSRIGRERGWPPMSRAQFDQLRSPVGAVLAGSPEEVAAKVLYEHELFQHDRFLAQINVGGLPHEYAMRAIELLGTEVAPVVRAEVAKRAATAAA
jgi:alkanesulfonate monooxygenase SsuD/methylene tetrahydromethanopterin reductase-like flavin-dependent oxidoreductase (luciferase family)